MSLWCHMWHCKFNISSRSCTPGMYKLYCCTLWPMVFCTCWSTNCLCCTARAKSGMHLLHELWTPLPLSWQTAPLPLSWQTPLPLSWQTSLPLSWQTLLPSSWRTPLPLSWQTPLPLSWQSDSLALDKLTNWLDSLALEQTRLSCPTLETWVLSIVSPWDVCALLSNVQHQLATFAIAEYWYISTHHMSWSISLLPLHHYTSPAVMYIASMKDTQCRSKTISIMSLHFEFQDKSSTFLG